MGKRIAKRVCWKADSFDVFGEPGGGRLCLKTFCAPFYIEYIEQDVLIQKTVLYRITLKNHELLAEPT